jgi:hypothetical protein
LQDPKHTASLDSEWEAFRPTQVITEIPKNNIAALLPTKKAALFSSILNNINITSGVSRRTRHKVSAITAVITLTILNLIIPILILECLNAVLSGKFQLAKISECAKNSTSYSLIVYMVKHRNSHPSIGRHYADM